MKAGKPAADDVTMEWLMDDKVAANCGMSLAKMTIAIGITSELHSHSNCTETLHLLEGKISQRIGDKWTDMRAGDTCLIPADNVHQTVNTGASRAVMILAYSAGTRDYTPL